MNTIMRPTRLIILAALALFAHASWAGGLEMIKAGQIAEDEGRHGAALTAYKNAIAAGDLTKNQLAGAYSRMAGIKGFLGENVSGIEDYSKAIELNPQMGSAFSLRGYLRGTIGQYDLAEKDHQTAVDLAKNQKWDNYLPWVLQHYADLWRRRGDFQRALAYCDRADKVAKYPVVSFRRAWIFLDMGRLKDARREFQNFTTQADKEKLSFGVFWPDERGAIARLREL